MFSTINKFLLVLSVIFACANFNEAISQTVTPKKSGVEREVLDAAKNPEFLAVGKIVFDFGQRVCTVVLVAEDIVLTAGHCLHNAPILDGEKILKREIFPPDSRTIIYFNTADGNIAGIYKVKQIINANYEPDFAILQLQEKISPDIVKPLKIKSLTTSNIIKNEKKLGCAGFNGDKFLGENGQKLTISRNIKLFSESSSKNRIDTNCISTDGGSGGIFFEETYNDELKKNEYFVIGIIWGVTNDVLDDEGKFINEEKIITSITPVSFFNDDLGKF